MGVLVTALILAIPLIQNQPISTSYFWGSITFGVAAWAVAYILIGTVALWSDLPIEKEQPEQPLEKNYKEWGLRIAGTNRHIILPEGIDTPELEKLATLLHTKGTQQLSLRAIDQAGIASRHATLEPTASSVLAWLKYHELVDEAGKPSPYLLDSLLPYLDTGEETENALSGRRHTPPATTTGAPITN